MLILGDFNLPDTNLDCLSGFSLQSNLYMFDMNLSQLIRELTHNKGNILDLLITNCPELVENIRVATSPKLSFFSSFYGVL